MWWNFIGRGHEDIVWAREEWQNASDRFGTVEGYPGGPPARLFPAERRDRAARGPAAAPTSS
ncbi:hypothetical protein ABZ845_14205 [Streptomyces sp. NPDC047022]|uniref:hypothetical protein n=1 Tax=Streptomyces sp. NPDC047022 TaxID=3155737 RepID=UPI0033D7C534